MALGQIETAGRGENPLDLLEEIIGSDDWPHDRLSNEELAVECPGQWSDYRLFFMWDESVGALHFSCLFDTRIGAGCRTEIHHLMALVNERLWLGHFDLSSSDGTLMFRHTLLLNGTMTAQHFREFINIVTKEPDRYFPAFQFVIWGGKSALDAMGAALIDVAGEA